MPGHTKVKHIETSNETHVVNRIASSHSRQMRVSEEFNGMYTRQVLCPLH